MQNNAIPCNTIQYHAPLTTADGAYHCPVGSIMAIFIIILGGAGHQDRPLLSDCERGQDRRVLRRVDLEQEVPGGL